MRETKTLEFKEAVSNAFLKTVSAFANGNGGTIIFGVTDAGNVVGVKNPVQTALDIENKINDAISPRPAYSLDIDNSTSCLNLNISEGTNKPYMHKGKAYVRRDTSSIEADQFELRSLILEGSNLTYDAMKSSATNLHFTVLEERLKEALSIKKLSTDMLKTLGLMQSDGSFTKAGEFFSDSGTSMGVDVTRFGQTINQIYNHERFDNMSVLAQYDAALEVYKRYYTYEEIIGSKRELRESVPESAFREALANALVHRIWDNNARVRIEMYENRIEVISPGGLPKGLSEKEYLTGEISKLRNPIVANVFFRLGLIENFGTGIRRIKNIYAQTQVIPSFRLNENSIAVVKIDLTDNQTKLLNAMLPQTWMSSAEIAKRVGFGKDKVLRVINSLIDAGVIEKQGTGRGTKYKAADKS
jgi:ATP-dependent DNA helicase RecG